MSSSGPGVVARRRRFDRLERGIAAGDERPQRRLVRQQDRALAFSASRFAAAMALSTRSYTGVDRPEDLPLGGTFRFSDCSDKFKRRAEVRSPAIVDELLRRKLVGETEDRNPVFLPAGFRVRVEALAVSIAVRLRSSSASTPPKTPAILASLSITFRLGRRQPYPSF